MRLGITPSLYEFTEKILINLPKNKMFKLSEMLAQNGAPPPGRIQKRSREGFICYFAENLLLLIQML
jgi:hypothetical protein